ncbi:MAG: 50S ribosomal protein L22 [Actinobacteria bacterium]|nr:50S ribosomal protein L22 [Actinomycetota bacterium]
MPGPKTNEREGTRAVLRHSRQSAYKVREVLDLIRGKEVGLAREILRFSERDAAMTVGKLLDSAIANAENNDGLDAEELFISACFADEGTTIKRWRPRARGRATRIRKRTCHVTVIVSRLPEDRLARLRAKRDADLGNRRARRVAGGRGRRRRDEQVPGTAEAPVTAETVDEVTGSQVEGVEETQGGGAEAELATEPTIEPTDETSADETSADEAPAESAAEAAEDEGIVDQQAAAIAASEQAGAATGADEATEKEEGQ